MEKKYLVDLQPYYIEHRCSGNEIFYWTQDRINRDSEGYYLIFLFKKLKLDDQFLPRDVKKVLLDTETGHLAVVLHNRKSKKDQLLFILFDKNHAAISSGSSQISLKKIAQNHISACGSMLVNGRQTACYWDKYGAQKTIKALMPENNLSSTNSNQKAYVEGRLVAQVHSQDESRRPHTTSFYMEKLADQIFSFLEETFTNKTHVQHNLLVKSSELNDFEEKLFVGTLYLKNGMTMGFLYVNNLKNPQIITLPGINTRALKIKKNKIYGTIHSPKGMKPCIWKIRTIQAGSNNIEVIQDQKILEILDLTEKVEYDISKPRIISEKIKLTGSCIPVSVSNSGAVLINCFRDVKGKNSFAPVTQTLIVDQHQIRYLADLPGRKHQQILGNLMTEKRVFGSINDAPVCWTLADGKVHMMAPFGKNPMRFKPTPNEELRAFGWYGFPETRIFSVSADEKLVCGSYKNTPQIWKMNQKGVYIALNVAEILKKSMTKIGSDIKIQSVRSINRQKEQIVVEGIGSKGKVVIFANFGELPF